MRNKISASPTGAAALAKYQLLLPALTGLGGAGVAALSNKDPLAGGFLGALLGFGAGMGGLHYGGKALEKNISGYIAKQAPLNVKIKQQSRLLKAINQHKKEMMETGGVSSYLSGRQKLDKNLDDLIKSEVKTTKEFTNKVRAARRKGMALGAALGTGAAALPAIALQKTSSYKLGAIEAFRDAGLVKYARNVYWMPARNRDENVRKFRANIASVLGFLGGGTLGVMGALQHIKHPKAVGFMGIPAGLAGSSLVGHFMGREKEAGLTDIPSKVRRLSAKAMSKLKNRPHLATGLGGAGAGGLVGGVVGEDWTDVLLGAGVGGAAGAALGPLSRFMEKKIKQQEWSPFDIDPQMEEHIRQAAKYHKQ